MYYDFEKTTVNHYIVYDKEGNYLFEGTSKEICKKLDITKSTITKAIQRKSVVRRKYYIMLDKEDIEDEEL